MSAAIGPWGPVTVVQWDDHTVCIVAPDGLFIYGGLSPDSLAVGGGHVVIGPVHQTQTPGVFVLDVSDEAGACLVQAPADNGPDPIEQDDSGPCFTLQSEPARDQLRALQVGIDYCLNYAAWKHSNTTPVG